MSTSRATRTDVFVSYSHKDLRWLDRLLIHLKPLVRERIVEVWNDTLLQPGTNWQETIHQALVRAKVAVLLISADFIASEFIAHEELPPLLAAAETEGAVILPVIISPSLFERTALVRFQTVNPPSKPLIGMSKARQEEVWVKVAEGIHKALGSVSKLQPDSFRTMPTFAPRIYSTTSRPPEPDSSPRNVSIGYSRRDEKLKDLEASARLRNAYESQLTKVKSYRRGWETPRCYVSHLPEQDEWANELIKDLRHAGVYVIEQAAKVQADDFVVVLDTPAFQKAFRTRSLAGDARLIQARLDKTGQLISLALSGSTAVHEFETCAPGNFSDETHYPVSLFDLVLNLYAIPLTHAAFKPLRQALHEEWTQTLAGKKDADENSPLRIFISYSHKDETFKDELVTTLAGLQRRGIVDTWQDRRIEAGDEWNKSIQEAMNDCDLALLLVSADYLASRFIQAEEQTKLLQRQQEIELRVIPIIVRPCVWQSEPVLKDLQALPPNSKAIITFSRDTGARDKAWSDIATLIEKRAHEQWKQTPASNKDADENSPLKIFISYSHKDETFKDELVTMLDGLRRRRIVDAWQDRSIEAGDEWNKSIQDAMDACDLALLLVSADYLASRFIQEEEQPKLLQRRKEMRVRVIPIIVRACPWQNEPALKDLQALPRDNKAVITFSKDTGARDQAWTDIALVIEKRAREMTPDH